MKKVLIVEDNIYAAEDTKTDISLYLRNKLINYNENTIQIATSIYEAEKFLQELQSEDELICVITDLNMKPAGLTEEQIRMTRGAILTGWIWCYYNIILVDKYKNTNIIFYSAFIDILRNEQEFIRRRAQRKLIEINKSEENFDNLCANVLSFLSHK